MMTLNGQTFAQAYANVEKAMGCDISYNVCNAATKAGTTVAAQPFFENALANTGYCTGFANCTAAVVSKQFSNFQAQKVWSLWSALDKGGIEVARVAPRFLGLTSSAHVEQSPQYFQPSAPMANSPAVSA
jgi:hypothetical protein